MSTLKGPNEAAEGLGVPVPMLKGLREHGALGYVRLGHRTIRYRDEDIEAFIDKHRVKSVDSNGKRLRKEN